MFDFFKRNLLKVTMLVDGAFSLAAGAALAALSTSVAGLLGPAFSAAAVLGIGIFLIGWGIFHLQAGRASIISPAAVRFAIVGDALWVVISAAVLIIDWHGLTALGAAAIAVLAVAVGDILLLKSIGLRGASTSVRA